MSFFKLALLLGTIFLLFRCAPDDPEFDPCQRTEDTRVYSAKQLLGYVASGEQGEIYVETLLPGYFSPRVRFYACHEMEGLIAGETISFSVEFFNRLPENTLTSYRSDFTEIEKIEIQRPTTNECQPMSEEDFPNTSQRFRIVDLYPYYDAVTDQYCVEVTLTYRGCAEADAQLYNTGCCTGLNTYMALELDYEDQCDAVQYRQFRFDVSSYVKPIRVTDPQNAELYMLFNQWEEEDFRTVRVL
jgi:hypothetical protein